MVNCGACGKFLASAGAVVCGTCSAKYHRACLALPDKSQLSKDWACPSCKKSTRRGDNSQTPVRGIYEEGGAGDVPRSIDEDSTVTNRPTESSAAGSQQQAAIIDRISYGDLRDLRTEIEECVKGMREFRSELQLLRQSFASVTLRLDEIEQRVELLEARGPTEDAGRVANLEATISSLKLELNDRDQEMLLTDVEIGHVPEEKGENAFHTVYVMASRLGVSLEERDVVFAERVGPRPEESSGRPRRLVVRLARRHLRDELLRAARVRRVGTAAEAGPRIFVNERLTRHNRQLFHRVREECRRLQWRFSWTRRGRIFARQGEGQPIFQFRSDADLGRAFGTQTK